MSLFPHQDEGIRAALPVLRATGGYYLIWDPGMGKTLAALSLVHLLDCQRVLVLAPMVALGVWKREIEYWMPGTETLVLRDGEWNSDELASPRFLITNYDQLVGKAGLKRVQRLDKLKFDMVVLDESHLCKNPSAKRTKRAHALASRSRYRLLLSGTPSHTPLDWWSQLRMVAPAEPMWAQKFDAYKKSIAILGGPNGAWPMGWRKPIVEEALRVVEPYSHTAKSDLLRLPEPITTIVPVQLSAKERDAYKQMETLLAVELGGEEVMTAQIVLTKMLRLAQITSGALDAFQISSSKLSAALELIDERPRQKIVVATRFSWERERLYEAISKRGRPVMQIYGGTPQDVRSEIASKFQLDDEPYVLLLQYKAGGMSLTLTAANTIILYSLEHSFINHQQMLGRCFRIGLDHTLQVIPLIAVDSIDETVYEGLQKKMTSEDLAKLLKDRVMARAAKR